MQQMWCQVQRIPARHPHFIEAARASSPAAFVRASRRTELNASTQREHLMNRTFVKILRTALIVVAVVVAISAVLALAILAIAPWLPDEISSGRIQWDDHSVALSNVFSSGFVDFMFAFGAMTLAMLITVVALIFSAIVTVIALAATAAVLALVACVVGFPFLLIVGIVWWTVRRNKRDTPIASPGVRA
jgi:Ca2+/Na+ antiporter